MNRLLLVLAACLLVGSAHAVGTSATLTWTLPTAYTDGTALPASQIASTVISWTRPTASIATGSVVVDAPGVTVVVPGLVCGDFKFTAHVLTTASATYPSAASAEASSTPATYATGVACKPNPPTGLTAF